MYRKGERYLHHLRITVIGMIMSWYLINREIEFLKF